MKTTLPTTALNFLFAFALTFGLLSSPVLAGYEDYLEQWAMFAVASSQYSATDWSASQATGHPNTFSCGDIPTAWATESADMGIQWIELTYDEFVYATGIEVYETWNPGAVSKVDLIDAFGNDYTVWEGIDNTTDCPGTFSVDFTTTSYTTKKVRVYLDTDRVSGWNEIDAIQLKGYKTYIPPPTPTVTFSSLSMSPDKMRRGEKVSFSVNITSSVNEINASTVVAMIDRPTGADFNRTMRLTSGTNYSGIWEGSWRSGKTSPDGVYKVKFYACDVNNTCNQSSQVSFELSSMLALSVSIDEKFNQTDTIEIIGTAKDWTGDTYTGINITVNLTKDDWFKTLSTKTNVNGSFSLSYRISMEDPIGTWDLSFDALDEDNNSGSTSETIEVFALPKALYYEINWLSPKEGILYSRGDELKISVNVLSDGQKVEDASVTLKLPTGERLTLNEVKPGVYAAEYRIGWDAPTGDWTLIAEGRKGEMIGMGTILIRVKTIELKTELIEPAVGFFKVGQEVEIKARVLYPDGSLVSSAEVSALSPTGKEIPLIEKDGIYTAVYTIKEGESGLWSIQISATGPGGNTGATERTIRVYEKGPQEMIKETIRERWYLILAGTVLLVLILVKFVSPRIRLRVLLAEQKKLEAELKKVERQYFVAKKIDRATFDRRADKLKRRAIYVKTKIKELRKK